MVDWRSGTAARSSSPASVGDFVTPGTLIVEVYGAALPAGEQQLRGLFALGQERTIEQDPAFALRILVDIAIKALSPAVNDPTTAVQVLDHIEAFVVVLSRTELRRRYVLCGRDGVVRVMIPGRDWAEYLELAVTEIRDYGATSTQVCRRLRALLDGLLATVPSDRRAAVQDELCRLDTAVEAAFPILSPARWPSAAIGRASGDGSQPDCRRGLGGEHE